MLRIKLGCTECTRYISSGAGTRLCSIALSAVNQTKGIARMKAHPVHIRPEGREPPGETSSAQQSSPPTRPIALSSFQFLKMERDAVASHVRRPFLGALPARLFWSFKCPLELKGSYVRGADSHPVFNPRSSAT